MPLYTYQNPDTGEAKDVFQGMNDVHEYSENSVAWKRLWLSPQAAANISIDPFSQSAYMDKLASTKGTYGDALDRSSELSSKRAEKRDGVDPVKQKYYEEYAGKRKGKQHPDIAKEAFKNATITI